MDYAGPSSNVRIERFSRESLGNGAALAEVLGFYESTEGSEFCHEGCKMEEKVDEGLEVSDSFQAGFCLVKDSFNFFQYVLGTMTGNHGYVRVSCTGSCFSFEALEAVWFGESSSSRCYISAIC